MHSLIVVAHPDPASLTHAVAARIGQSITGADARNSVTLADLAAEGFDPRLNAADIGLFKPGAAVPADAAAAPPRPDSPHPLVPVSPLARWAFPPPPAGLACCSTMRSSGPSTFGPNVRGTRVTPYARARPSPHSSQMTFPPRTLTS